MPKSRREEANRWFQQAIYDLKAAQWNIQGEFFDTACFLSQQSAEKAVKSILYYLGARRKALLSHSIFEMMKVAQKMIKDVEFHLEEARALDLHYVPSRYPNGLPSGFPHRFYSKTTAIKAVESASKIVDIIKRYYEIRGEKEILAEEDVGEGKL
jgi:HEPN domain-containing protein